LFIQWYVTRELQLIGFNLDRAAVQLGVSLSWGPAAQDREKWRKLAARLPLELVKTKPIFEQTQTERTQSEHWALLINLAVPGAQPASGPDATTWSHLVVPIAAQGVGGAPYNILPTTIPNKR
jgi:hypothetical protein